jgi:hypothetical protein
MTILVIDQLSLLSFHLAFTVPCHLHTVIEMIEIYHYVQEHIIIYNQIFYMF